MRPSYKTTSTPIVHRTAPATVRRTGLLAAVVAAFLGIAAVAWACTATHTGWLACSTEGGAYPCTNVTDGSTMRIYGGQMRASTSYTMYFHAPPILANPTTCATAPTASVAAPNPNVTTNSLGNMATTSCVVPPGKKLRGQARWCAQWNTDPTDGAVYQFSMI